MFLYTLNVKRVIYFFVVLIIVLLGGVCLYTYADDEIQSTEEEKKYIKWVDFNIPYEALEKAMNIDIKSQKDEVKLSWIEILSHLSTKYGGDYKRYKAKDMDDIVVKMKEGKSSEECPADPSFRHLDRRDGRHGCYACLRCLQHTKSLRQTQEICRILSKVSP